MASINNIQEVRQQEKRMVSDLEGYYGKTTVAIMRNNSNIHTQVAYFS